LPLRDATGDEFGEALVEGDSVGPSPTGATITSGSTRPSCSHTSKATVFFASMVIGLAPVFRSSQPNVRAAARERSTAAA
jgi:hypothetical protein